MDLAAFAGAGGQGLVHHNRAATTRQILAPGLRPPHTPQMLPRAPVEDLVWGPTGWYEQTCRRGQHVALRRHLEPLLPDFLAGARIHGAEVGPQLGEQPGTDVGDPIVHADAAAQRPLADDPAVAHHALIAIAGPVAPLHRAGREVQAVEKPIVAADIDPPVREGRCQSRRSFKRRAPELAPRGHIQADDGIGGVGGEHGPPLSHDRLIGPVVGEGRFQAVVAGRGIVHARRRPSGSGWGHGLARPGQGQATGHGLAAD